eukprot:2741617-Prymnesium_polylepis.1
MPRRAAEPNSASNSRRSWLPGSRPPRAVGERPREGEAVAACESTSCRVSSTARAKCSRHSCDADSSCARAAASAASRAASAAVTRAYATSLA